MPPRVPCGTAKQRRLAPAILRCLAQKLAHLNDATAWLPFEPTYAKTWPSKGSQASKSERQSPQPWGHGRNDGAFSKAWHRTLSPATRWQRRHWDLSVSPSSVEKVPGRLATNFHNVSRSSFCQSVDGHEIHSTHSDNLYILLYIAVI